jgi:hypothetical protein
VAGMLVALQPIPMVPTTSHKFVGYPQCRAILREIPPRSAKNRA